MAVSYFDPPSAIHRIGNVNARSTVSITFPTAYRGIIVGMASGDYGQDFMYMVKTPTDASGTARAIPIVQAANVTITEMANCVLQLANGERNSINCFSLELLYTAPPVITPV